MSMESRPRSGRLALLVAALALTGLIVGIWGAFVLGKTDAVYSDIVDVNTRVLADLQALTRSSANVHRHCLNLLLAETPSEIQPLKSQISAAWQENDARLDKILQMTKGKETERLSVQLKQARDAYFQAHESYVSLATQSARSGAMACKTNLLRPAFDAYQAAQSELAEHTQRLAGQASDATSARAKSTQRILIGFASWPFIFAFGVVVISVISFILLFRHLPSD